MLKLVKKASTSTIRIDGQVHIESSKREKEKLNGSMRTMAQNLETLGFIVATDRERVKEVKKVLSAMKC